MEGQQALQNGMMMTKLDRGFKDLVYDSDGDDLTYIVVCQNCPGAHQELFQVIKDGNVHKIRSNNPLSTAGILQYQKSAFSLEITASDGEFSDKMIMQIFVADINVVYMCTSYCCW